MKWPLLTTIILITLASVAFAEEYKYIPNVNPHTRYNNIRDDCYYYYGYGSCNVTKSACTKDLNNKWINLGDACNRDTPPKIAKLQDLILSEGEKAAIPTECEDEDPVKTELSGWTEKKITYADYESAGEHAQKIVCTDSFGKTTEAEFRITIINTNRPPLFKSIEYELNQQK